MVSSCANFQAMGYSIEYFHARVKEGIESWPVVILADFARMIELSWRNSDPVCICLIHGRWAVGCLN